MLFFARDIAFNFLFLGADIVQSLTLFFAILFQLHLRRLLSLFCVLKFDAADVNRENPLCAVPLF